MIYQLAKTTVLRYGSAIMIHLLPQDLHIHTVFSSSDSSIVPEQTIDTILRYRHARIIGISDHLECLDADKSTELYMDAVREAGLLPGIEVNGAEWVERALEIDFLYFVYHCRDKAEDYRGALKLLTTGRPVIIAHPHALGTNLDKVPPGCHIEINNRYVWRTDWLKTLAPYANRFSFVLGSDAHQPNWLNQHIAGYVAETLGIKQTILFEEAPGSARGVRKIRKKI